MGAQQSSTQGDAPADSAAPKTCFYELLGVDRLAGDEEIKKSYRRKALELHPDRNLNDVETATRKFAEIQAAYDVLSDPQERAWYDSHRDAILSGRDGPDGDGDGGLPTTFRNVRLTSTQEILGLMRRFNAAVPFDDEPTGFYGIARETFEHLALEEEAAADFDGLDVPEYPTFGSSTDEYDPVVRPFYTAWAGFSTRKSFAWKDKYRLSDAPDRRVRRLMEKENKKIREDAAREFNDAVRFLVTFVRKRDPRYLPNSQTEAERQRSMRDAAAAQAARSRAANQEKLASYDVPEWARSRDGSGADDHFSEPDAESEIEVELLECVVCNKKFKSDKQLEAHERSKKHAKAVQQLRWQMRKDGIDLDRDSVSPTPEAADQETDYPPAAAANADAPNQWGGVGAGEGEQNSNGDATEGTGAAEERDGDEAAAAVLDSQQSAGSGHSSESDDYAPRRAVEGRLAANATPYGPAATDSDLSAAADGLSIEDLGQRTKIGKAKLKREKKAAQRTKEAETNQCSVCRETFDSRSRLFQHIRDEDHAAVIPKAAAAGKKKRR